MSVGGEKETLEPDLCCPHHSSGILYLSCPASGFLSVRWTRTVSHPISHPSLGLQCSSFKQPTVPQQSRLSGRNVTVERNVESGNGGLKGITPLLSPSFPFPPLHSAAAGVGEESQGRSTSIITISSTSMALFVSSSSWLSSGRTTQPWSYVMTMISHTHMHTHRVWQMRTHASSTHLVR